MSVLATFVLYAFNEEKFIREAVASALAQTYSPLEIVLSDDGSSDRTYAIMEKMVGAYRGPHRIILNRNPTNIGIGSQLNAAVAKTKGSLILLANGDDRSRPQRVAKTVEAWKETGCRAACLVSPLDVMDETGRSLPARRIPNDMHYASLTEGIWNRFAGVGSAASAAYRREVFSAFPPLNPTLILEDNPLYMRAMLLGVTVYMREALVDYRLHGRNLSQAYSTDSYPEWRKHHYEACTWQRTEAVKAYGQMLVDLSAWKSDSKWADDLENARATALEKQLENEWFRHYYRGHSLSSVVTPWRTMGRLLVLAAKLTLKRWAPFLEERGVRAQFRKNRAHWNPR